MKRVIGWSMIHQLGRVIQHEKPTTFVGEAVKKWLDKPVENTIQLPRNPLVGISLAIAGHSIWNGSSWLISYIFRDVSDGLFVIVNLGWIVVLIAGLWFIGREILASVKHLPS